MTKRPTDAKQDFAYEQGYNQRMTANEYVNRYDSDKDWFLYLAFQQGWNDRRDWELSRGAVSAHP